VREPRIDDMTAPREPKPPVPKPATEKGMPIERVVPGTEPKDPGKGAAGRDDRDDRHDKDREGQRK
jgi:hypothetical protein